MDLDLIPRSVVLLNARSLVNKNQFGVFELLLHNNMFNIITVCETWLKPYIPNNLNIMTMTDIMFIVKIEMTKEGEEYVFS